MKTKNLILTIGFVLLLSSCVVKSLHPFYTKETVSFDENFIGEWKDNKGGKWKVISFADEILEGKTVKQLSKEDIKIYEEYKNGYYIQRTRKGKEVLYLANPFKINNQTFLDFLPLGQDEGVDNLLQDHLIYAHSLVKYDVLKSGEIDIKWFDEDKIQALFKDKKIKIKHEKVGIIDENYLLTAKSEELQKFIKKYMVSDDAEKWKTSTKFTLTKTNATP